MNILLKLEIRLRSYSLAKKLTFTRHKVVKLILRKCADNQEMSRLYTVEVEKKINMGRLYTYQWKRVDRSL